MNATGRLLRSAEFDAFGVAVGTAVVAGALSLVAPFLVALTGTLAALAVTSWTMLVHRESRPWSASLHGPRGVGVGALLIGVVLFVLPVSSLSPVRGLVLALTLLPLWWAEHRRPWAPRIPGVGP